MFPTCRYKNKLKFDFYIPSMNLLIEYQGIQHFKAIKYFGGQEGLETRIIRDNIKREWVKERNLDLLEIRYDDKSEISTLIEEFSHKLNFIS